MCRCGFLSGNSDISKELNQYNATFITTRRSTENRSEEKTKTRAINAATHSWKVSKYGPEINLYLETFHAVTENIRTCDSYLSRNVLGKIYGKGAILPIVKVAEQSPGFVLRRCFKKFSQNSQKNTCDKVAFLLACSLYKKGIYCRCSSMNFAKSSGHLFCREPVRG